MTVSQAQFERFLKDISDCFIHNDFEVWRTRVHLPFSIAAHTGLVTLETEDALRENFDLYISACKVMRLDVILRDPILLEDCGDGTWLGTYETRLVSHGVLASEAYVSTALLQVVDGWVKMSSILNARGHYDWTGVREP